MRTLINDLTDEDIQKRVEKGFGQGQGATYIPWLSVRNVSSKGRSCRLYNPKLERTMTFFSKLEEYFCYILMWKDDVIDIREQYPLLPRSETQRIAEALNIRHPRVPKAKNDLVMTTDFLLTVKKEGKVHLVAIYVKHKNDLENNRTREKYMIEKEYWNRRGIEMKIVTENSFLSIEAENISRVMEYYKCPVMRDDGHRKDILFCYIVDKLICSASKTLQEFSKEVDKEFAFTDNESWKYLYHLIANKLIPVSLKRYKLIGTARVDTIVCLEKLSKEIEEASTNAIHA